MKYWKYYVALITLMGLCQMCLSGRGGGVVTARTALGSRPSRYSESTGYRSASPVRTKASSSNRVRRWTVATKSTALRVGFIFISHRMRARFGSRTYYDDHDVTICRDALKYPTYNGSTASEVGWFLCPLENEHNIYCCGANETYQHCCSGQFKGEMTPGTIAGVVIACIIVVVAIAIFTKCMYC